MKVAHRFTNPFRPGAGHMPPYLAGREHEKVEFARLLEQTVILQNMVLTGLRGVGKTVLLDTFKPIAVQNQWLWVGTDLSESTSVNETQTALRLLTDLSVVTSNTVIDNVSVSGLGFNARPRELPRKLNFNFLAGLYESTPGLVADKLKAVLEFVGSMLKQESRGLVFAYDEAQNMSDHADKEQYPLATLLDVFQSIQKKGIPFMLVLTGLPTLFPKLVEARTFSERMFRVVFLNRLNRDESREAIVRPIKEHSPNLPLTDESIEDIIDLTAGYPYFIQFVCREVYDAFLQRMDAGENVEVPVEEITRKLDSDFFAGRWARATDRQRELLLVISSLENADSEFTVQEIVEKSRTESNPFGNSHVSQMLHSLSGNGIVYKNRHGKYSFAVPLLGQFLRRQRAQRDQGDLFAVPPESVE